MVFSATYVSSILEFCIRTSTTIPTTCVLLSVYNEFLFVIVISHEKLQFLPSIFSIVFIVMSLTYRSK
jgi:hypothetical protein